MLKKNRQIITTLSYILLLALPSLSTTASAQELNQAMLQKLTDRAAVEDLIVRYVTALDSRDADLYVSVFTEDAVFAVEAVVNNGHEEIRQIITGLQESRDRNDAQGIPNVDLYHVLSNSTVKIIDASHATHQSYWQTVRKSTENNNFIAGAMGQYHDEIVKQDGQWRIKKRVLSNFVPFVPSGN